MRAVVETLEKELELIGLTGVDDRLQHDVRTEKEYKRRKRRAINERNKGR